MDVWLWIGLYLVAGLLLYVTSEIHSRLTKGIWAWEEPTLLLSNAWIIPLTIVAWLPMLLVGWYRPFA